MSSDYRYLVIQKNQDGSFSKVTDFTSLTNYTVVKISYQNNCNNDSEENQICFKFDEKHYIIDWNINMNINIGEIKSNLLDIKFLLKETPNIINTVTIQKPEEVEDLELNRLIDTKPISTLDEGKNEISNTNTDKYYKALRLENTANSEEIKKAYHTLALQYHPDKGGNPVKFNEIQNAYNCLIKEDCS